MRHAPWNCDSARKSILQGKLGREACTAELRFYNEEHLAGRPGSKTCTAELRFCKGEYLTEKSGSEACTAGLRFSERASYWIVIGV